MKKMFLIAGVVVLILVFVLTLVFPKDEKKAPVRTPLPTESGSSSNNYFWTKQTRDAAKKSYAVGELIDKLPYSGNNFTMNYDINEDEFTVVLNSENVGLANKEFDAFLADNNIGDRNWITNLVVKKEALRL